MRRLILAFNTLRKADLLNFSALQLLLLFAYFFEIFSNPLNLDNISDRLSADFYNYVYAPYYGTALDTGHAEERINKGQKEILVVLINDRFLDSTPTRSWPISPALYKPMLTKLANSGAVAVFVDVYFQHSDATDEQVADLLRHAQELTRITNVPIYFAGMLSDPEPVYAGQPAVLTALAELNVEEHTYVFKNATDNGETRNSAAYALYLEWCKHNACEDVIDPDTGDYQMFLRWGTGPDSFYVREIEDARACEIRSPVVADLDSISSQGSTLTPLGKQIFGGLGQTWSIFFNRYFQMNSDVANPSSCLYHRNLGIGTFMNLEAAYAYENPNPDDVDFASNKAREWTEGKVVLLGTDIDLFRDITWSPVHQFVPGVFKIATALDNMIESGDSYLRWVPDDVSAYTEILILLVVLVLYILYKYWSKPLVESAASDRLNMLFGLNMLLLLMVMVIINIHVQHWAPNNWISYLFLYLFVSRESFGSISSFAQRKFFHHQPHNRAWALIWSCLLISAVVITILLSGLLIVAIPTILLSLQGVSSNLIFSFFLLIYLASMAASLYLMHTIRKGQDRQIAFSF